MPPTKEQQAAEATARTNAGVQPGESLATDVIDDVGVDPAPSPQRQAQPEPEARPTPPARSQHDSRRDDIVARFRTDRAAIQDEQRDDITDFARSGMPPEFTEPNAPVIEEIEPEPAAATAPAPAAAPQKVKLKVRGQEIEVSLEEALAHAQISYAADNYLDEAKSKLGEVNQLLTQTRNSAPRAGQDGAHPAAPQGAKPTDPDDPAAVDPPQHPEDPIDNLIQTIQFGDPEEAKVLLRDTIAGEATKAVSNTLDQRALIDEGARTAKVLKDFEIANPEIAKDDMARAAIEARVLAIQREDIKALGIDPATMRPDGLPPTPGDIANAHRFYRAKGFKVTAPADMLQTATDSFLEWKGVKKPNTPADPAPQAQPRVDLTIDRSARRQAAPQQPTRTAAPQPAQTPQPAKPRDRSAIVESMRAKRAAPRGQILA